MENELNNTRQKLEIIQSMIDISTDRLDALRTQCATSSELTQQEIRTLETKLVKMFSELLLTKAKLSERFPKGLSSTGAELKQWLRVVGLSPLSLDAVWQRVSTLELLLDKSNNELRQLIRNNASIDEGEILRWQRAMFHLKRCHQTMAANMTTEPIDLSWTCFSDISNQSNQPEYSATNFTPENNIIVQDDASIISLPRTPFKRGPLIAHRFTKKFKALSTCDFCNKQMFFGLKCIECKYSCHKDCEASVPPSCGVPPELKNEFKQSFSFDAAGAAQLTNLSPNIIDAGNGFFFSSTRPTTTKKLPETSAQRRPSHTTATLKNYFEDLSTTTTEQRDNVTAMLEETNQVETSIAKTLSFKSPSLSSYKSSISSLDSIPSDSTDDRQSEWGIQFDDINILDKIGSGRFGTVHRAQWYGDVAVKLLNANYLDDAQTLEAFKNEVATLSNTRHENLVLFMGFCIKPQAIVTSLCKGNTLYTHIHVRRDKFSLYRAANVAQQISNGMGYLHAKGIVHKDLTTKNIFLENCRIVITDFGLFSSTKMQYSSNGFHIPNNWLCYLAPELIRGLKQTQTAHDELHFSKASDVYGFGTVWYEILCGEVPFKQQPPHSIIFQIGCGMKQTLANLQATREVKDILMMSWTFQPDDRPDFSRLLLLLKELPKKQMPKTPTRRLHMSLSAESVF